MEELQKVVDLETHAKARAAAMGFIYRGSTINLVGSTIIINGRFDCVCGKTETYNFKIDLSSVLDPAALLDAHGAFSAEHLTEDGYTIEEIEDILNKGKQFDENYK